MTTGKNRVCDCSAIARIQAKQTTQHLGQLGVVYTIVVHSQWRTVGRGLGVWWVKPPSEIPKFCQGTRPQPTRSLEPPVSEGGN
jgi:hypothetical protein